MSLREIAQKLIDELETSAAEYRLRAEGVALLFNKIVEANEKKAQEVEAAKE